MKKHYLKIYARFEKCQELLASGKGLTKFPVWAGGAAPFIWMARLFRSKDRKLATRAKACDKLFDRLVKAYDKMKAKGVTVSDLPDPRRFSRNLYETAVRRHRRRPPVAVAPVAAPVAPQVVTRYVDRPVYMPVDRPVYVQQQAAPAPASAPAPRGYTPVSQEYLRDQEALEREYQSPSYGSDAEELAVDLRASCSGYLFGGAELDYFGGSDPLLSDEDEDDDDLDPLDDDDDDDDEMGFLPLLAFMYKPAVRAAKKAAAKAKAKKAAKAGKAKALGADDDDLPEDDSDILFGEDGGASDLDPNEDPEIDDDAFISDLHRMLAHDAAIWDREALTHEPVGWRDGELVRRNRHLRRLWAEASDHGDVGDVSDLERLMSIEPGVRAADSSTHSDMLGADDEDDEDILEMIDEDDEDDEEDGSPEQMGRAKSRSSRVGRRIRHLQKMMAKNPRRASRRLSRIRARLERRMRRKMKRGRRGAVHGIRRRIAHIDQILSSRGSRNFGDDDLGLDDELGDDDLGIDDDLGADDDLGDDLGDDDLGDDLGDDDLGDDELGDDDLGDDLGDDDLGDDELGDDELGDDDLGDDDLGADANELGRLFRRRRARGRGRGRGRPSAARVGRRIRHLERLMARHPGRASRRLTRIRTRLERRLQRKMRRGGHLRAVRRLQRAIGHINQILSRGSRSMGIDFGRLQPRSADSAGAPVLVIAIRKRESGKASSPSVGGAAHQPGLMDVFAADMMGSLGSVNASFPSGDGAPLLPPRRVGREVYAG
jgi:hypothetical protein